MRLPLITCILTLAVATAAQAAERIVRVGSDAALRQALRAARPGTRILIAPGRYQPGVFVSNLSGTAAEPVVVEGADAANPPLFEGGGEAWHFSRCAYITLRNVAVRGQTGNGINIDDGGSGNPPAHHIVLEKLRISDIGPKGNYDAVKLSGLDDFVVRDCVFDAWAGQAPDMVGCHRGLIEGCTFRAKPGFSQNTGPQTKGGSSQVVVRRCLFLDAAERGVNIGGSTGGTVFRPKDAKHEAQEITVEGCTFVGCEAPVAYVGLDGGVVRYNTIYRPRKWILRILQENNSEGFPKCGNGRFEHNLIVFRKADVGNQPVNVGPNTKPETFHFADNWWYCEDQPQASRLPLPAAETGATYGIDPQLAAPLTHDFRPLNLKAAAFGAAAFKAQGP